MGGGYVGGRIDAGATSAGEVSEGGRQERGLTLHQAADLIQRSASTLQPIEKGTVAKLREVDLDALCRIYEFGPDHTTAMKGLAAQGNEQSWWYEYGGPALVFTSEEWSAFVEAAASHGRFDG